MPFGHLTEMPRLFLALFTPFCSLHYCKNQQGFEWLVGFERQIDERQLLFSTWRTHIFSSLTSFGRLRDILMPALLLNYYNVLMFN